jgi:hypothetical protein
MKKSKFLEWVKEKLLRKNNESFISRKKITEKKKKNKIFSFI